jgi:ribosomal-protein-alanine N-acetyltransferase
MATADLPAVVDIEAGSYSHPWTAGQLAQSLVDERHRCRVAVPRDGSDALAGYAVTMAGVDECHLLNLTVRRDWRRLGLARWMLARVVDEARAGGHTAVWLEVRASNEAALRLYEQAGFVTVGRRPGYYPALRGREDALLMTLALGSASPPPAAAD